MRHLLPVAHFATRRMLPVCEQLSHPIIIIVVVDDYVVIVVVAAAADNDDANFYFTKRR